MWKLTKISKETCSDKRELLVVEGRVKHKSVRILIDSGATGSFIHPKLVSSASLSTVKKSVPDQVRLADGHIISSTHVSRVQFRVVNSEYQDQDTFNVVDLGEFDMVLGRPWLHRINPDIDWVHDTLKFKFKGRSIFLASKDSSMKKVVNSLVLSMAQFRKAEASKPKDVPLLLVNIKQLDDGNLDVAVDSPTSSV